MPHRIQTRSRCPGFIMLLHALIFAGICFLMQRYVWEFDLSVPLTGCRLTAAQLELLLPAAVAVGVLLQVFFIPRSLRTLWENWLSALLVVSFAPLFLLAHRSLLYPLAVLLLTAAITVGLCRLRRSVGLRPWRIFQLRRALLVSFLLIVLPGTLFAPFHAVELSPRQEAQQTAPTADFWAIRSARGKARYLSGFLVREAKALDVPCPKIVVCEDNIFVLGHYNDEEDIIYLNLHHIDRPMHLTLQTAMHELYHSYQMRAIDGRAEADRDNIRRWKYGASVYMTPGDAIGYAKNPLEVDARAYAKGILEKYGLTEKG